MAGSKELKNVNTLYVNLRYYFPLDNKFTWDRKGKDNKEKLKEKKRKMREKAKKKKQKEKDKKKKDRQKLFRGIIFKG